MDAPKLRQPAGRRLPAAFYTRSDVVALARELLGKKLVTQVDGVRTSGLIVETEAYRAPDDKACHAFNNRRTPRTEVMFARGGHAYVYLCYGIHHLFNVVTGPEGMAHAVLIRAVEPLENPAVMLERRRLPALRPQLSAGPGVLTKALGITTSLTGSDMTRDESPVWLEYHDDPPPPEYIGYGPRIGVESAGECALWPWRFWLKNSPWVSRKR